MKRNSLSASLMQPIENKLKLGLNAATLYDK